MLFMKNNKNTTRVHPHPQIPAVSHRESQIPASHRRRKIPKIQKYPKSKSKSPKSNIKLSINYIENPKSPLKPFFLKKENQRFRAYPLLFLYHISTLFSFSFVLFFFFFTSSMFCLFFYLFIFLVTGYVFDNGGDGLL
jgi:hypothetical protein